MCTGLARGGRFSKVTSRCGAHLLGERRFGVLSLEDGLKASALLRIHGCHMPKGCLKRPFPSCVVFVDARGSARVSGAKARGFLVPFALRASPSLCFVSMGTAARRGWSLASRLDLELEASPAGICELPFVLTEQNGRLRLMLMNTRQFFGGF